MVSCKIAKKGNENKLHLKIIMNEWRDLHLNIALRNCSAAISKTTYQLSALYTEPSLSMIWNVYAGLGRKDVFFSLLCTTLPWITTQVPAKIVKTWSVCLMYNSFNCATVPVRSRRNTKDIGIMLGRCHRRSSTKMLLNVGCNCLTLQCLLHCG